MVMVWLEGGQGEVRGACPPRTTPNRPTWTPPPPPPTFPTPPPPPLPVPPPPPFKGAFGPLLLGRGGGGAGSCIQKRGDAPPPLEEAQRCFLVKDSP